MNGALYGPAVAQGDWYRLITAAFLHYGPIHLAMNMLALWWIGRPLEAWLGPVRYLLLYLVSGLAGSAGALIANPEAVTVGASGAIFGILGAAIVLERQQTYVLGGSAITLLVVNLAFTRRPGDLDRRPPRRPRRRRAVHPRALPVRQAERVYSRIDLVSIASIVAVGLLSVAVAYWKVRGYAWPPRRALEASGLSKTYRGGVGAHGSRPSGRAGRGLRLPRTKRCRQEHDDQAAARSDRSRQPAAPPSSAWIAAETVSRRAVGSGTSPRPAAVRPAHRARAARLLFVARGSRPASRRALRAAQGRARPSDPGPVARQPTKIGTVQAFMHRPELAVLDEPTSGLDPLLQTECGRCCARPAADGRTVFLLVPPSTRSSTQPTVSESSGRAV